MDINEEAKLKSFCWRNGVTIYPVQERGYWYIQADNNGRKTTYRAKELSKANILKITPDIYNRILKCYEHWKQKLNR